MVQETTGRGPVVRGIYFIMHLSAYHSFAFSDSGLIPTKGTGSLSPVSRMALLLAMQMLPLIFFSTYRPSPLLFALYFGSQPWHYWHFELNNSVFWGLSHALQEDHQLPCSKLATQEQPKLYPPFAGLWLRGQLQPSSLLPCLIENLCFLFWRDQNNCFVIWSDFELELWLAQFSVTGYSLEPKLR